MRSNGRVTHCKKRKKQSIHPRDCISPRECWETAFPPVNPNIPVMGVGVPISLSPSGGQMENSSHPLSSPFGTPFIIRARAWCVTDILPCTGAQVCIFHAVSRVKHNEFCHEYLLSRSSTKRVYLISRLRHLKALVFV